MQIQPWNNQSSPRGCPQPSPNHWVDQLSNHFPTTVGKGTNLTLLKDAVENMIHDSFKFVRRLIQKYPEIFFGKQLVKLSTLTNPLTNPLKRQRTSTYNEFLWIPVFPAMSPLQWVSLFRKPIDVPMFLQDEVNCAGAAVTASLCPLSHELIPWDFTVRPKPPHPRARYSGSTQVIFGSGKLKSTCGSCEEYIYIYYLLFERS